MRIYLPIEADHLQQLAAGRAVEVEGYLPSSTDEEDELAALETAAEQGRIVAVAETTDPDGPITLDLVEALHVAVDDSGDLAWFGTQEIAAVIELVQGS
ncbi:hypothetical protein [Aeromicrobium sp. CF3.5]|uniref:hypothetical protein n=1 Tax=Aeromicrobium sp. CF3.5 TaxID=3373078 RepID=UPI003EE78463